MRQMLVAELARQAGPHMLGDKQHIFGVPERFGDGLEDRGQIADGNALGQALAKLNQNQVALQAAFQVSATLNQLSLLNYLNN